MEEGSLFPHPLQNLLLVDIFDDGHSDQCEVIIHCGFDLHFSISKGFPGDSVNKKKIHQQCRRPRFGPLVGKIPWRSKWQPTPLFLPGEFHGRRSLASYRGCKESDVTKGLSMHNY